MSKASIADIQAQYSEKTLETAEIQIVSGEGETGTTEDYDGERTFAAIRRRLTEERAGGDRWAHVLVDGQKIPEL